MAFSTVAKYSSYPKVLLFTSTGNMVGSAASASQFALASAQSGLRTLLVDADLGHPDITRTFEATNRSGVSDILSRTLLPSDQSDLVMSTVHANLFLMPAGTENSSVLADYETSHISALLDSVKNRADIVVINVPSCDIIADASRLAKFVDEVFLVLSARSTHYRSVPIAYDILRKSGAKEVSLILVDASAEEEAFSRRASSANILD
jgi:tyrosine-protein kinase Etk/Wzc